VCIRRIRMETISPRLRLQMFQAQEKYVWLWVRMVDDGPRELPEMTEVGPTRLHPGAAGERRHPAAAGRQIEGFLDSEPLRLCPQREALASRTIRSFPTICEEDRGWVWADYISSVSNYAHGFKHFGPANFLWHRRFEVFLPLRRKLTVMFPHGKLHILNGIAGLGAPRRGCLLPICRKLRQRAAATDARTSTYRCCEDIANCRAASSRGPAAGPARGAHFPADTSSIT